MNQPVDKAQLKRLLKPLIKECLQDILLQEGLLSKVISEVMTGLNVSVISEAAQPRFQQQPQEDNRSFESFGHQEQPQPKVRKHFQTIPKMQMPERLLKEERSLQHLEANQEERSPLKVLAKTGLSSVFDGLSPIAGGQSNAAESTGNFAAAANASGLALKGIDPTDAGVPLEGILQLAGGKKTWQTLANAKRNVG